VEKPRKQAGSVYSAEINKWVKSALRPGARTGELALLIYGLAFYIQWLNVKRYKP